jgi:hypothetical protein
MVMYKAVRSFLLSEILDRIGPEDISHETMSGRLSEAINLIIVRVERNPIGAYTNRPYVIQGSELGGQTTVNAKELLVHDGCQRQ